MAILGKSDNLEDYSKEELIEIVKMLLPLVDRVTKLEEELNKLKNKNSRNSSLPPSRDKQVTKKKTSSLRGKSGRKPGGQKGHKGSTLNMSDHVDIPLNYDVDQCKHCHEDLSEQEGIFVEKKQVWDIPPSTIEVTEHTRWKKQCTLCDEWTSAQFDESLRSGPPVRYGDNLVNQVSYFHIRQLVPYKRLTEIIEVLYAQKISEGTIDNMLNAKAKQAADTYEKIITEVENSKVVGVDESGCSVNGDKSWVWAWVTMFYSLFYISENRGHKTAKHLFPSGFIHAILTSDCWRTHLNTPAKNHQLCIPHLQRTCQALIDFHSSTWSKKLFAVFQRIMIACRRTRIPQSIKDDIEKDLDKLLSRELTKSHKEVKSLKSRLVRLRPYITVCLYNRKVPPDNNWTERAIRMIKLKLKISGTFRSWKGADRFALLRTIVDSAIKQGIHPFDALENPDIVIFRAE